MDLDLPSGTKWMKYNLGSNSETDYGQLYSFGSISPSPARVDSLNSDMVFINEDGDNQLKTDYDAIYQKTEGQAILPNSSEIEELINETNKLFIENYNGSGVNVIKISSKEDDSKYIIIPLKLNSPELRYGIGLWSGIAYRRLSADVAGAIEIEGEYIGYNLSSDTSPWIGEYYPLRGVMVPPPIFP